MSIHNNNLFEYRIVGNGKPNVIFLNGFRMPYESWDKVYPKLSSDCTLLLFNRRGIGSSMKAKGEQHGMKVIDEMRSLFASLEIHRPYLFVAHSLGGVFANLYVRVYPHDVFGMVFIEASHPSEVAEQKAYKPPFVLRAINEGLKSIEKLFDKYQYSEDDCIEDTIHQLNNAGPFPNIPLAVVTGTKKMPLIPEGAFDTHKKYQTKLLELSAKSRQYVCQESGHFPQITEPEKVIMAIRDIMNQSKISG